MNDKLDLEAAMRRLADIVAEMEGGELPLEQSISLYNEGITLSQQCLEMIRGAQQVVEQGRQKIEESLK